MIRQTTFSKRVPRPGYSLAEALILLAIVLIIMGLVIPAVLRARESSHCTMCQQNLHQLAMAVHVFHNERGHLPPYATGKAGEIYGSWFVHLLPFVDQQDLYERLRANDLGGGYAPVLEPAASLPGPDRLAFSLLQCRSDATLAQLPEWSKTNYVGNWYVLADGSRGAFSPPRRLRDLADGASNVVLFAETYAVCDDLPRLALISSQHHNFGITSENRPSDDPSYAPDDFTMFQVQPNPKGGDAPCHQWRTQTPHKVMHIALADASVRAVASISLEAWKHGLKPCDGQPLGE